MKVYVVCYEHQGVHALFSSYENALSYLKRKPFGWRELIIEEYTIDEPLQLELTEDLC